MITPFGYFDLLETFPQAGCAVCRLLQRDVERFLDTLLYEHTVDPPTQTAFRASRGLCHDHTWMLPRLNNALAVGILYDAVLDELLKAAERAPAERQGGLAWLRGGTTSALADALEAQKPCPACVVRDDAEGRYLQVLGEYVLDERLRPLFEQSDGLCLRHFRGVLRLTRDAKNSRLLIEIQTGKWRALKGELELLLHKLDAHYHETPGAEATSWLRALARVAGEQGFE
ncbi:MAG: DUF6062 family protein [Chloroflexota bacterium]